MCALEVSLFDAPSRTVLPVAQGSVIWIRADLSRAPWETLTVSQARPLIAFELLERVLEYEGLSGRFVLEPPRGECTTLKAFGELQPRKERLLYDDPGGRRFAAQGRRSEHRLHVSMPLGDTSPPELRRTTAASARVGEMLGEYSEPALLFYLLGTHYSHPLADLSAGMREAVARVERVREVAGLVDANSPAPPDMDDRMGAFRHALARDLDTPTALRVMFDWLRAAELRADRIGDSHLREMLGLLSLDDLLDEDEPGFERRRRDPDERKLADDEDFTGPRPSGACFSDKGFSDGTFLGGGFSPADDRYDGGDHDSNADDDDDDDIFPGGGGAAA